MSRISHPTTAALVIFTADMGNSEIPAPDAIKAIKSGAIGHGDVIVLICSGPKGAGMQEIYQVTSALKALPHCKHVAVLTDARFSGVSTGACIGHISPEALAEGPIGKVLEGDLIEIVIDRDKLVGTVNLVGDASREFGCGRRCRSPGRGGDARRRCARRAAAGTGAAAAGRADG